jgi:hypothetical protein
MLKKFFFKGHDRFWVQGAHNGMAPRHSKMDYDPVHFHVDYIYTLPNYSYIFFFLDRILRSNGDHGYAVTSGWRKEHHLVHCRSSTDDVSGQ